MRLYVKLEVDYPDNPRMIAAGERAEVLYIRALCLCKRTLSDGFIDSRQLPRFGLDKVQQRADDLVKQGLWEIADGGYLICGWMERNKSSAEVQAESEAKAEAGRRGGLKSGASRQLQAKTKQSASPLVEHRDRDIDRAITETETVPHISLSDLPLAISEIGERA